MKEVKKLFDDLFKKYNENLPSDWLYSNEFESFYLKKIINKIKPKFILDAGCGICLKMKLLKNYKVIGFDYSISALEICKKYNFNVVNASIHQIPFKNETFDFVYCFQVIQHLPSWEYIELSFKEISRILKTNGYFLTINYRLYGRLKEKFSPMYENDKLLYRWAFDFKDYFELSKKFNLKVLKIGTILNFKPKGIGKFPFLKSAYKIIDYYLFKFGYKRGLYLVGLFKKL